MLKSQRIKIFPKRRKTMKRIISVLMIAATILTVFAFAGCNEAETAETLKLKLFLLDLSMVPRWMLT